MKKFALVLALIIAAGIAFAEEPAPAVTASISGSSSVTFTADLDTAGTTLSNSNEGKLKVTLVPKDSNTAAGEGAVYGEIKLKDFEAVKEDKSTDAADNFLQVTAPSIDYAKVMGDNWYVKINGTDAKIDYESMTKGKGLLKLTSLVAARNMNGVDNDLAVTTGFGGITAGVTIPEIVGLDLSLYSLTDVGTSSTTPNDNNAYGITFKADLKAVSGLTFQAGLNMGFGFNATTTTTADDMGFGVKAGYKIDLGGDMFVEPMVALDAVMRDDSTTDMALGNGILLGFNGDGEEAVDVDTKGFWDDEVYDGLTIGYTVDMDGAAGVDPVIGLQATLASDTLVENLMFGAGFEMENVTATTPTQGMAIYAQYAINNITPYAGFQTDLTTGATDTTMKAGVMISDIVPKVNLDIDYVSGNLALTTPVVGTISATVKISY